MAIAVATPIEIDQQYSSVASFGFDALTFFSH
jgi:hypothetical protein